MSIRGSEGLKRLEIAVNLDLSEASQANVQAAMKTTRRTSAKIDEMNKKLFVLNKELEESERTSRTTARQARNILRQTTRMAIFSLQATGDAMDRTLYYMMEMVWTGIEVAQGLTAVAAAAAAGGPFPWMVAARVVAQGALIGGLLALVQQIKNEQESVRREVRGTVSGLRLVSYLL